MEDSSMVIYLAILEDCHVSIHIRAFKKIIKALKQITEWQNDYDDEVWEETEIDAYEYYISSECDDGPKMWVEKTLLK